MHVINVDIVFHVKLDLILRSYEEFKKFGLGCPLYKYAHLPTCHAQAGMLCSADDRLDKNKLAEWRDLGCGGGEYQSNILQNFMENCSIVEVQAEGF